MALCAFWNATTLYKDLTVDLCFQFFGAIFYLIEHFLGPKWRRKYPVRCVLTEYQDRLQILRGKIVKIVALPMNDFGYYILKLHWRYYGQKSFGELPYSGWGRYGERINLSKI